MSSDSAPSGSNILLWLVALIGISGAAIVGLPRTQDSSPPKSADTSGDSKSMPVSASAPGEPNPLVIVEDFFRLDPKPAGRAAPGNALDLSLGRLKITLGTRDSSPAPVPWLEQAITRSHPRFNYEFMICTVPDPVDTKFAWEFDATVEAIQRAFEARGFLLHTSWLPWPRKIPDHRESAAQQPMIHRDYPGTMLFRKLENEEGASGSEREMLAVVCLIGENPISGPHKIALGRALDIQEVLTGTGCGVCWARTHDTQIRVVGPNYSGSLVRLVRTIQAWVKKDKDRSKFRFQVISGSGTALSPEDYPEFPGTIQATVIPDELVSRAVRAYLAGKREEKLPDDDKLEERVAILRESNTGFGAARSKDKAAKKEDTGNGTVGKESGQMEEKKRFMDLPFPMSISQLRSNLGKHASQLPWESLPKTDFTEPRLPDRAATQLDGFNPYDPESAATVAGQTMRSILTTIERSGVQYVGIVATDARDIVFLHHLIRQQCPNVRVFTTEPSIAFIHPDEAYHMRGMIVGGSYPLNPTATWWTTPRGDPYPNRRLSFSSQATQGYYNAVIAQSGEHQHLIGYHAPFKPELTNRPPIWISVVGQGGTFIPVHAYSEYDDGHVNTAVASVTGTATVLHPYVVRAQLKGDPDPTPRSFPIPIIVLVGELLAAALLAAVIVALAASPRWPAWAVRRWTSWAGGRSPEELSVALDPAPGVWLWRAVILASILLFALPYSLPASEIDSPPDHLFENWRAVWRVVAVVVAVVIAAEVLAVLGLLVWRAGRPHPGEKGTGYWVLAGLTAAATLFAWTWWLGWGIETPVERYLLYYRVTDLTAGMSPLVPMGLVALAGVAVGGFSLGQADIARRNWLRSPYRYPWSYVQKADEWLDQNCRYIFPRRGWAGWGVIGCLFALAFLWSSVRTLPSGEGEAWDKTMTVLFWVVGAGVVLTLVRFLFLWAGLRTLLGEIMRVPMVGAFERIPDEIGRLFGGYLYSQRPRHGHLGAAAWALPADEREALARDIAEDRPRLAWVFGHPLPPDPDRPGFGDEADRLWLSCRLKHAAVRHLAELPVRWEQQDVDEAFGVSRPAGRPAVADEEPTSTYAAERYVACYVVLHLGLYFSQLRKLVFAFVLPSALLLFAAASYPFQPNRPRLDALAVVVIAAAISIVYVLYAINRDGLISRITRTPPDRFSLDAGFFSSIMKYIVPLLLILAAQLFGLFRFILEPLFGLFQ